MTLVTGVSLSEPSIHPGLLPRARTPLYRKPLTRKDIDDCGSNGLMNIETGGQIDNKWFFLAKFAFICGTVMATLLDAMPVNAARTPLYRIPFTQNHRRQWLQLAHEHID